ncbi:MAG: hypothetical protein KAW12_30085 [Candidatus Aminicenantes bacterium]|nr:hypothetical protein [Candidatus Aminicenantes bacterium]
MVREKDDEIKPSEEVTQKIDIEKIRKKLEEITFEEGEKIPEGLKSQCNRNAYGGFSLNYNNFIYVLDADYRVEMRRADTAGDFILDAEEQVTPAPAAPKKNAPAAPAPRPGGLLQKGDLLPEHLRGRCEVDLGSGGYRIRIGSSIYVLDEKYHVVVKMTQTPDAIDDAPPGGSGASAGKKEAPKQDTGHPPEKIVASVLKKFEISLKADNISADLFIEQTMGRENIPVLVMVYQGNLTGLNADTQAAAKERKPTKLKKGGISLLKAALVHELYMKSTSRARGENMKEFLTHIISPWKKGAPLTNTEEDLSSAEQGNLLSLVGRRGGVYRDIGSVLQRVYGEMKDSIFSKYRQGQQQGKTLFKAFLIDRLYEITSRPEKSNGVSLISLIRDIMDFQG